MNNIFKRAFFVMLAMTLGSLIVSCSDDNEADNNKTSMEYANILAIGRAHNEIMCHLLLNTNNNQIFNFNLLNEFNEQNLYGVHMIIDTLDIQSTEVYDKVFCEFSYSKVVSIIEDKLNSAVLKGDITSDFKNLILSFYQDENELEGSVSSIIDELAAYETNNHYEEKILQTFGYLLIYSYSLWTTVDEGDMEFISRDDYAALCDAGGGIVGGIIGGWVGAIIGGELLSAAARSDVDNARICLCWGMHPNNHEADCRVCNRNKIIMDNRNANGGELQLSNEAMEMINKLSETHPPITL